MRAETDFCVGEQIYSLDQVQTYNTNITCADLATHEHGTFPSTMASMASGSSFSGTVAVGGGAVARRRPSAACSASASSLIDFL